MKTVQLCQANMRKKFKKLETKNPRQAKRHRLPYRGFPYFLFFKKIKINDLLK